MNDPVGPTQLSAFKLAPHFFSHERVKTNSDLTQTSQKYQEIWGFQMRLN